MARYSLRTLLILLACGGVGLLLAYLAFFVAMVRLTNR